MGRGRQKAKQTKVARELKYFSPATDLTALERELGAGGDPFLPRPVEPEPAAALDADEDDPYDDWSRRSG